MRGAFTRPRADRLAAQLDLDLDSAPICLACLYLVAIEIEEGDPHRIRGALVRMTPHLWAEGLSGVATESVHRAVDRGVPDADAALTDLAGHGGRSGVARAIVRRLAEQLLERMRELDRIHVAARSTLDRSTFEWN